MKEVTITELDAQARARTELEVGQTVKLAPSNGVTRDVVETQNGQRFIGWMNDGKLNFSVGIHEATLTVDQNRKR